MQSLQVRFHLCSASVGYLTHNAVYTMDGRTDRMAIASSGEKAGGIRRTLAGAYTRRPSPLVTTTSYRPTQPIGYHLAVYRLLFSLLLVRRHSYQNTGFLSARPPTHNTHRAQGKLSMNGR